MNDYKFGNFLYSLRTEKNMSQAELGRILGVTNKAVSKWENGTAKPSTKLIPRLAEVFGLSVEELFACKRFKSDSEAVEVTKYLQKKRIKLAKLSSVFLSLLLTLPFLMVWFSVVVVELNISDEVIGPLGAMLLIFTFIVSLTSYIIYRRDLKGLPCPASTSSIEKASISLKKSVIYSFVSLIVVSAFTFFGHSLFFANNKYYAGVFLAVGLLALLINVAVLIYLLSLARVLRIKLRVLRIKLFGQNPKGKQKLSYRDLPLPLKVCNILSICITPLVIAARILCHFHSDLFAVWFILMLIWGAVLIPTFIFDIKRK